MQAEAVSPKWNAYLVGAKLRDQSCGVSHTHMFKPP